MKKNIFTIVCLFVFLSLVLVTSCKDEWNKHFQDEANKATKTTITEYIRSTPELSRFSQMLTITGFDTILKASQTYTVWAPTNDALENIDMNDKLLVSDIVKNHIARFSYPTSGIQSNYVMMINGKKVHFYRNENGFSFGGKSVETANTLLSNGIVHVINGYVPYNVNILEYIMRTPGLDSLSSYISSQHMKVFDVSKSTAVSIDSLGNTVYDSVFVETNVLMDKIGKLDAEDSIYTVILPDNNAWNEAYNRIKPYFAANNGILSAYIQRDSTRFAIVRDMVFRTLIDIPASLDSIISTSGDVFHQPGILFPNSTPKNVSNGLIYVTSQSPFKAVGTWQKTIQVEAERTSGRTNLNSTIYLGNSYGSSLNVSNKAYITVSPTTTSSISKVYVDFSIPHPLSAKYNIYCVFVPGSIANASDQLPCRALFYLLTWDQRNSKWIASSPFSVTNNVTNPNSITKMLIAQNYKFAYYDPDLGQNHTYFGLRVQNDVGVSETAFNRTMRIDCIILEPVSE